jgi:TonB family protein
MLKTWFLVIALTSAAPDLAQAPSQTAARNMLNGDMLLKLYPPRALAAREQGSVGFEVSIDSKGHPTECSVIRSSGYPLLDDETCQLITQYAQFEPSPGLSQSQVSRHQGVVNWTLPATAGAPAANPTQKTTGETERVICKRVPVIGSNVGTERVCQKKSDWQKSTEQSANEWRDLQGKGFTSGN